MRTSPPAAARSASAACAASPPTASARGGCWTTPPALVTALNPYIGYARSSEIAKEALATGKRVYDLVLESKLMTREDLDALLRPEVLTQPHFSTVHRPKTEP